MFFRAIDKFFDEIKHVVSIIIFALIAMSTLMFLYWLAYSAKIIMPDWLNTFVWAVIDFFAQSYKDTDVYKDITDILPVLTSVIFGVITYFANCLIVFLENNHKRYRQSVVNYRVKLEKTINEELRKDFLNELNKTSFMIVKIKITAQYKSSYLTAMTDEQIDAAKLEKEIEKYILSAVKSQVIEKKGKTDDSVYFLISDLKNSKEFFTELVSKSSELIKSYLKPKLQIGFYCGAELFNDFPEFAEKEKYVDRILNLKIANKIIVTPRFKVFYDNIYTDLYNFGVQGEYNLNEDSESVTNTMLYTLQRK